MTTHFGKVIRNCELLFAIANIIRKLLAFWHHIHKMCPKKGKFVFKKKIIWQYHLKSDLQLAKSNPQCQKNLANHFAKVIRNYPKSDLHLAM